MEAILIFVAFLGALHSWLRCRHMWGSRCFSEQKPEKTPFDMERRVPAFWRAYKELPVIALIVIVGFIAVIELL